MFFLSNLLPSTLPTCPFRIPCFPSFKYVSFLFHTFMTKPTHKTVATLVGVVAAVSVVRGWLGSVSNPERLVPSSPSSDSSWDDDRDDSPSPSPSSWTPPPQRGKKCKFLDDSFDFSRVAFGSPDMSYAVSAMAVASHTPKKRTGIKKSVAFAEMVEVCVVSRWIDPKIHKHRESRGRLAWGIFKEYEVSRWIEPDGHNQLHFPRTKWIED